MIHRTTDLTFTGTSGCCSSAAVPAAAFLCFHFAVDSGLCMADAAGSVGNDVVDGAKQRQASRLRLQATH